ncbi:HsdR family type I site-specific deoxyribonuclease [Pseudarthrobacter sp. PS3-L1]|uniref:type I restriction endonuclease subunit R n=1 Tax=Pseudarthrobacter sp. PS3-L1 TaxID=3046207 RepID=UPI0024BB541D|nr:HsdR family type I site-specific deoxyribonuclease [Pseudarthrobacter sp. PS3-L1]MDJ0322002.1 HsdR family type I site-specific deoxyribonuclease [Pseudarthrobacter sp. PS3-L1]
MAAVFNEANSVQAPIVGLLEAAGWTYRSGTSLDRAPESVLIEDDLTAALIRLNPRIAEDTTRVQEILSQLRMLPLAVADDGLVHTNETFTSWLRGHENHQYIGTAFHEPVHLIDFENPAANTLVVSDEVTFGVPGHSCRLDIVLWVNGIPLVVGETKTSVDSKVSWIKAAKDIHDIYEKQWPQFFAPGVFSFATEGREFHYGAVGQSIESWQMWGSTSDEATLSGWPRVKRCVELLLTPETVLDVLAGYTVYELTRRHSASPQLKKIVCRYPQYEAVTALHRRALDPDRHQGLIFHTQGSGKTLAMVFAAARMLKDPRLKNPTVVMIADRKQLVRQTYDQFRTVDMPRLETPETSAELRAALSADKRGVVFTTVHKFRDAGLLNDRENIIVLVDEAHRTQEGQLGNHLRAALPKARFFGFTGTPIADTDRNTFALFGDPSDPGHALNTYDSDRSIADGTTVPIHVQPRLVEFHIDKDRLEKAFGEMVEEEGLDETQREYLSAKVSSVSTFFSNPERIRKVCQDIVDHFYSTVDPLGMKAQVVVYDRALCVAYDQELRSLLAKRAAEGHSLDGTAVVMSVRSKDDGDWQGYKLSEQQEEDLLDRFRALNDPLKFLIVTSKLGTGFNADNEGVMYLDKPMKLHTLYQTITRTNRRWKNPETGQEKRYGLIVDYVGLGDGFARAMSPANPEKQQREIEVDALIDQFVEELEEVLERFEGIDRTQAGFESLQAARQRIPTDKSRDRFAARFQIVQGIWEACYPDMQLDTHRDDYRWLGKVYQAVMPTDTSNEMLWHRLGAKTLQLVHGYITDVRVRDSAMVAVIADAETIKKLIDEGLLAPDDTVTPTKTAEQVMNTIADRIRRRLQGPNGNHTVYKSLAERLDQLRERTMGRSEDSIDLLRDIFQLAKDVTVAEHAEDADRTHGLDLLPDPNVGALTQIFEEFVPKDTPIIVGHVVADIDSIVKEVRYDGWSATQQGDRLVRVEVRKALVKYGLTASGELFDRAYAYIAAHY